jgi:squalene-hopene/tetraprenyl-beta-curcumene cyclase
MLELLGEVKGHARSVKRAIAYLRRQQDKDGPWYGRWGVNYVYGTGLTLAGLRAVGESSDSEYIRHAVRWLDSHQNTDGGWGETCETYVDPSLKGTGSSTASQTAWALIGLLASGEGTTMSAKRGIGYLLDSQGEDGSWREDFYTGTGFPRAFYLRYDLYRIYFPLLALSQYRDKETAFD